MFSRIQNLHFSQTDLDDVPANQSLVEFKIYTSLKHGHNSIEVDDSLVEFKIYTSLKLEGGIKKRQSV